MQIKQNRRIGPDYAITNPSTCNTIYLIYTQTLITIHNSN